MKVVVIDDHPLVKMGVEMVAKLEGDIQMVGSASGGEEAQKLMEQVDPDVALVDLRMPQEHGLDFIKRVRDNFSRCKFIILTSYATEQEILRAMALGVDGYILKEALPEELISAIRLVHRGKKYYDPVVVQFAMEQYKGNKRRLEELTPREMEVLIALSQGMNNKEIATDLVISEHTVKKHIGQILEKLELKDRTQAALYAVSRGLNKKASPSYDRSK